RRSYVNTEDVNQSGNRCQSFAVKCASPSPTKITAQPDELSDCQHWRNWLIMFGNNALHNFINILPALFNIGLHCFAALLSLAFCSVELCFVHSKHYRPLPFHKLYISK